MIWSALTLELKLSLVTALFFPISISHPTVSKSERKNRLRFF